MFVEGFDKVAGKADGFGKTLSRAFAGAQSMASAAGKGLEHAGGSTVGDALKLKGLRHFGTAAEQAGGAGKLFSTVKGRKLLGEAAGKAAPSLAVGAGYAYGAKKVYDKTLGDNGSQSQNQAMYNYYGQ